MLVSHKILIYIKRYWLIILLTLIGAFLRLYNIKPTISFMGDQGRDVRIVRDLLTKADPILVGPTTSVGKIQLGPLYYYYMVPWLWLFNFDPVGTAVGVAFLGIISIPLLFFITKSMFNVNVASIASILYTFAVVVIQNTRSSWNPNPMPLLAILLIYSLYQVYVKSSNKHIILSILWFAVALQMHYMILLISPLILFILAFSYYKSINKTATLKSLLWGSLLFLLFLTPLIIFDIRHDFINTKGLLEFFQKGHHSPVAWYQPILDSEGRVQTSFGDILGLDKWRNIRNPLALILFISSVSYGFVKRNNKTVQIIVLYSLFGIVGMSIYKGDLFNHYLGFFFPIPFLTIGILLAKIAEKGKILGKLFVALSIIWLIVLQVKQYSIFKPLGWQINDIQNVASDISTDAGSQTYNILLLDDTKDYRSMNYRYFLESMPTPPVNELNFSGVNTLYLISQYQDIGKLDLHVWELETFIGQEVDNLQRPEDTAIITDKIRKQWHYDGGPWIYKIVRS